MFSSFVKNNWKYFLKYAIVGASGTIIDVAGFSFLLSRFPTLNASLLYRGLTASGTFLVAVINNFTWNKLWTFHDHQEHIGRQFVKFLVVSIGGFILNIGFLFLFSYAIAFALGMTTSELPVIGSTFAKLGASGVVLMYNFTMNRWWTFKPAPLPQP